MNYPQIIPHIVAASVMAAAPALTSAQNIYSHGKLANGLEYHLLRTPSEPGRIDVRMYVGVGASDENGTTEIGTAHMVEHMVFRHAPDFPDGVGDTLIARGEKRGANFNAMTNYERTIYMFSPNKGKKDLDNTLRALAAMMGHHRFSDADWQKEKQVIMGEWRNGQGVGERMNRARTAAIRSGSRQSRHAIIGSAESIQNTPVQVLEDFHRRWYVPNNMKLMVSGDIREAEVQKLIEQYFGGLQAAALPDRSGNYYEPVLENGWHIKTLSDKDSGASQIALILRLDDSPSRDYSGVDGRRERLIDRFAAHILAQRLKNQKKALDKSLSSVTLRKADIGRHTVAVGIFGSVKPDGHTEGLHQLLKLREQLLRAPVTQAEFDDYMKTMQAALIRAKAKTTLPEPFGDAILAVSEPVFDGREVRTSAQNAALIEPMLNALTVAQIDQRIKQWLNADDKMIQAQAPGLHPVTLPETAEIAAAAQRLKTTFLPPLQTKTEIEAGEFTDQHTKAGKIISETHDKTFNITHWKLSNGDQVVYLNHPTAKGKLFLHSVSGSGFLDNALNPWQSQTASQIVWQSAPQGWSPEQISAWKTQNKVNLNHNLGLKNAISEGSAPVEKAAELLHLYRAYQITPQIGEDYREALMGMSRQYVLRQSSDRAKREEALVNFRFGGESYPQPNPAELEATEESHLLEQWQLQNSRPATHYIVSDMPAAKLKPLAAAYLAAVPRSLPGAKPARTYLPLGGAEVEHVPLGGEQRSDVSMWSFTEQAWQPQLAAQISMLQEIAAARLKDQLRDKALGVYSVKFETTLNPEHGRVESEIRFSSGTERADDLWKLAETTLQKLPDTLTEAEISALRHKLAQQEKNRITQPETILRRLVLSETHLGDARYLSDMHQLPESMTLPNMRQAAHLLWNTENRRVLVMDPQQ